MVSKRNKTKSELDKALGWSVIRGPQRPGWVSGDVQISQSLNPDIRPSFISCTLAKNDRGYTAPAINRVALIMRDPIHLLILYKLLLRGIGLGCLPSTSIPCSVGSDNQAYVVLLYINSRVGSNEVLLLTMYIVKAVMALSCREEKRLSRFPVLGERSRFPKVQAGQSAELTASILAPI